jgi:hypothetical protein
MSSRGRALRAAARPRPPSEVKNKLAGVPETAVGTWASFVETPETVTQTVKELTGRPARLFAGWARAHAGDFR